MLGSGDIAYAETLPLNQWADVEVQGIGAQIFISVRASGAAKLTEEVTILMGIWGTCYDSGPMAIKAPIQRIGQGFLGQIKYVWLTSDG